MLGFLVAAIAGALVPKMDEPVTGPVVAFFDSYIKIEANETRAISFMIALLIAAILSVLLDSGTVFGIVLGVVLGYFGPRIYALLKRVIEARTDVD
jgi:ABC-type microcin C transport system permease subunit YejE